MHLITPIARGLPHLRAGLNRFSGGPPPTPPPPSSFVTRDPSTGNLMFSGKRFKIAGANVANDVGLVSSSNGNAYGGTVVSGSYLTTHSQVDAVLASAQAMNATVLKATVSVKATNHVLAVQPTLGVFNAAALDPIDYFLSQCASLGIKVIIPFCEQYTAKPWYVAQTGGGSDDNFYTRTATVNAYKAHISFVLNHVNTYTGVALKNDPTVLCWQIGNEFLAPTITEAQYVTWADDIVNHIKVVDGAQQLVQDGHYGAYGLASTCDIYDQHAYDQYRTVAFLENECALSHAAGKAEFIGEFDWTDAQGSHTPYWYLDQQLDSFERSANIDGGTFWDLLAPLTTWGDGFTLKRPGTTADMIARGDRLADHALRMAGIVPKQFLHDTFTDTNGVALSSHVGEAGATWNQQDSYAGVSNIQSNRLYGGAAQGRYYSTGVPASADYTVSADIYVASVLGYAGVMARAYTALNYSYAAYVKNDAGTVNIYLNYAPPGTLASHTITTPTVGSTHNLELKVEGSALSVYWDSVLVIGPITNAALPAAGRAGLISGGGGSATTGFQIDDISATDL